MVKFKRLAVSIFSLLMCTGVMCAQSFSSFQTDLSKVFESLVSKNEGLTSFRSLVIPKGGRDESLGQAFTGLCDDLNFMNYNPAASSILKNSQAAFNHNSWIADSKMETLTYSSTRKHMGFGGQFNCFYMPFTEYNLFGERVNTSYYTESTMTINWSYNFLAGYDFKGIAFGVNLKGAWRSMPDYADNNTNQLIQGSGLAQSGLGLMADVGLMLQFNVLKFYSSRDANVRVGIAVQNLGAAWTGFGEKTVLDDPLPSSLNAGVSLKFIKPITLTAEIKQPFQLSKNSKYELFSVGSGVEIRFTNFLSVMGGFQIKGGNPKISLGTEFEMSKVRFNLNYTLDLTTSFSPVNRFSASCLIQLGDHGYAARQQQVDKWYNDGIYWYSLRNYEMAKACWNEALKIEPRFDPAITGIKTVDRIENMFQKLKEAQFLE